MPGSLRVWIGQHRAQLRLSLRIIAAGLLTFAIGHLLGLSQAYWAVLTAVIVTQASIGGSLKAAVERFVGSLGGAAWGTAASLTLPHATVWGLSLTLTVTLAPLAVLTALNSAYRIAPVTAVILLLTPTSQSVGPIAAAEQRLLEIGLGAAVALVVALVVLPERARGVLARTTAGALETMAELTSVLVAGLAEPRDARVVDDLNSQIRKALIATEAAADEAAHERRINLSAPLDPKPLCRTLRRLHNDLAMLGRAGLQPAGEPIRSLLAGPASAAGVAIAQFMRDSGQAIAAQAAAPATTPLELALSGYGAAVTQLRREGLTRALPDDEVGRIFGLTFALEQLAANLHDLADRANELAVPVDG